MVTEKVRSKMDRNTDALVLRELHTNGPRSARELAKILYGSSADLIKRQEVKLRYHLSRLIKSGLLSKTGHIYSLTGVSQYWPDVLVQDQGKKGELHGAVLIISPTDVRFFPLNATK